MTSLYSWLGQVFRGAFIRDVTNLSLGTVIGKAVTVASLPLLTRLYSPDDFALLAVYLAIVSTIAVIACLRFEIAIPLSKNDDDAKGLLILALLSLVAITCTSVAVTYLLKHQIVRLTQQPEFQGYLWLIPVGIAALGLYSISQYWATRTRQFTLIARTRVSQALVGVGASISLGLFNVAPLGLLLGNLLAASSGTFGIVLSHLKANATNTKRFAWPNLIYTFRSYSGYPVYSTPEAFFNTAGAQLPIVLVAVYAGAEAGFLMLALQVVSAPMSLIGKSISQVYISRAPQSFKDGTLSSFTQQLILQLLKIGALPFLLVGFLAPWIVPYVFGESWTRTGEIISWLVPSTFLQFLVSPVSMVLYVIGRQSYAMTLQIFGLLLRVGAVLLAVHLLSDHVVEAYAVSGALFYALYLLVVIKVKHDNLYETQ